MGHWSEDLVDEAMRELGGNLDRTVLTDLLAQAGREIDVLSGRTYHPVRRATSVFEPNGLPLVDVPDLLVGSVKPTAGVWPVPDPTNPQVASVLQLESIRDPVPTVLPIANALWFAGQLVAEAEHAGRLSRDYILHWLGAKFETEPRTKVFRRVMDPAVRFSIPILDASAGGWWFQISRRLLWQTDETEDEGRLLEPLLDKTLQGDPVPPLVAVEPILIAVPLNRQPVEWAFAARIWPEGVKLYADHSWPRIASAIHGHGIPTVDGRAVHAGLCVRIRGAPNRRPWIVPRSRSRIMIRAPRRTNVDHCEQYVVAYPPQTKACA